MEDLFAKREVQYVDSHAAIRDAFVCPAVHVAKNTLFF